MRSTSLSGGTRSRKGNTVGQYYLLDELPGSVAQHCLTRCLADMCPNRRVLTGMVHPQRTPGQVLTLSARFLNLAMNGAGGACQQTRA